MIKLIRKISLFVVVAFVLTIAVVMLFNTILKKKIYTTQKADKTNFIFGHSHPECAFNDTLIEGFANQAQSGEAYFYTYPKIRILFKDNPQIKNVFIEFSNNQITAEKTSGYGEKVVKASMLCIFRC